MDLDTGEVRDTRVKVPKNYKVAGERLLWFDAADDLQVMELKTGQVTDTRKKLPSDFVVILKK